MPAIVLFVRRGQVCDLLDSADRQLEGVGFFTRNTEVGPCFGITGFERKRAFITQNGFAILVQPKIRVPQIVKERSIPVLRADKVFVAGDRLLERCRSRGWRP